MSRYIKYGACAYKGVAAITFWGLVARDLGRSQKVDLGNSAMIGVLWPVMATAVVTAAIAEALPRDDEAT